MFKDLKKSHLHYLYSHLLRDTYGYFNSKAPILMLYFLISKEVQSNNILNKMTYKEVKMNVKF